MQRLPWRRASQPLFWLLLILIAQQGAVLTWRLVDIAQPVSSPSWQPQRPTAPAASPTGGDLGPLARLALFGKVPPANTPKPVRVAADAPKTRLNVQLAGVLASSDPAFSIAIIANGGKQNSYGVDDTIDGTQARIREVYADRVIIEHQGRDETLMLDGEEYGKPLPASQSANEPDLGQVRQSLLQNPGKLTDYLAISPVRIDGKMAGYRLNPGREPALFTQLGLQANDLAVSINGLDLRDNGQAMQAMQQLSSATEVTVTVERDGQRYDIPVGLAE